MCCSAIFVNWGWKAFWNVFSIDYGCSICWIDVDLKGVKKKEKTLKCKKRNKKFLGCWSIICSDRFYSLSFSNVFPFLIFLPLTSNAGITDVCIMDNLYMLAAKQGSWTCTLLTELYPQSFWRLCGTWTIACCWTVIGSIMMSHRQHNPLCAITSSWSFNSYCL